MLVDHTLYHTIRQAIQAQKSCTGRKPSLVQINRQDYQELTSSSKAPLALGISIDSVNVISFMDVEQGCCIVVP